MFGLYCFITAKQRNSHLNNWIDPRTVKWWPVETFTPLLKLKVIMITTNVIWFDLILEIGDFGNRLKTDYVKFDYVKFNCHFLFFCYTLKTDYVQVNCHFLSFVPSFTDQSWPSNPFVSWLLKFLIFLRFFSSFSEVERVKKWHF